MAFGESAAVYDETRQLYTNDVINSVMSLISHDHNVTALDIGCGTGIATRQLVDRGLRLIGTDIDQDMIDQARLKATGEEYALMAADRLAFPDHHFDIVTAFGAFHWFCDDVSIAEIKRVLKPGGHFITVNKTDTGTFRSLIVALVSRHVDLQFAHVKASYAPAEILQKSGFRDVTAQSLPSIEYLSPEAAIMHIRTMRLWQEIPEELHDVIGKELSDAIITQLDGAALYERAIVTNIVSGSV